MFLFCECYSPSQRKFQKTFGTSSRHLRASQFFSRIFKLIEKVYITIAIVHTAFNIFTMTPVILSNRRPSSMPLMWLAVSLLLLQLQLFPAMGRSPRRNEIKNMGGPKFSTYRTPSSLSVLSSALLPKLNAIVNVSEAIPADAETFRKKLPRVRITGLPIPLPFSFR